MQPTDHSSGVCVHTFINWVHALRASVAGLVLTALAPAVVVAQEKAKAPERLWRVHAEYTYKGEPLVLEFGLACSSIWAGANTNKYSKDMFAGPALYGVKTSDGKAVVMSTRNFCDTGLYPKEPNGGLTDRFLPMTVVYDDAETLAFGTLYASDEAYQNPLSVLTIPRVTFTLLTPAAFIALQSMAKPNVVQMVDNNSAGSLARIPAEVRAPGRKPLVGTTCFGKRRLSLPESVKEAVRAAWPEGRPAYWLPDARTDTELRKEFWAKDKIWRTRVVAGALASHGRGSGLNRHGGGGADRWHDNQPVYAWYPERLISRGVWNSVTQAWEPPFISFDLETAGDRTRGFLYCYSYLGLIRGQDNAHRARMASRAALSVDGTPVQSARQGDLAFRHHYVVERDEALLIHDIMELGPWGEQLDD